MNTKELANDAFSLKRSLAFDECFEDDYFNCCPLDDIGVYQGKEAKAIRLYHCINFKDMDSGVIERLKLSVEELIESDRRDDFSVKHRIWSFFNWLLK